MKRFPFYTIFALGMTSAAFAGPQYIDQTGYAISGHDVVAYFGLTQAPIGQKQPAAVAGRADITAEYNGATFAFATNQNRETFLKEPERYVPVYDGHCAYGVSLGNKVPGNPMLWRIVDGRLYLNMTKVVVSFWEDDIPGNIDLAENLWSGLESRQASADGIPRFISRAPVKE